MAVQEEVATLRHAEIVDIIHIYYRIWNKAGPKNKRKLIVEQIHRQKEFLCVEIRKLG